MQRKIDKMSGHVLICGFDRLGSVVCEELARENVPLVVIGRDPSKEAVLQQRKLLYVPGPELTGREQAQRV